jgi:hypothetical protein
LIDGNGTGVGSGGRFLAGVYLQRLETVTVRHRRSGRKIKGKFLDLCDRGKRVIKLPP